MNVENTQNSIMMMFVNPKMELQHKFVDHVNVVIIIKENSASAERTVVARTKT